MRSILPYLLLVGTPVLGLLAILRIGQGLAPPISVAGTWSVEVSSHDVNVDPWVDPFGRSGHPILNITQSGRHLLVAVNGEEGIRLEGEIKGPTINAEALSRPSVVAVNALDRPATEIHFRAGVDRRTSTDRLLGELRFNRPSCPNVSFIATREHTLRTIGGK